jgi:hypothetical protein
MKIGVAVDDASIIKIVLKNIKYCENASVQFHMFSVRSEGNSANFAAVKKKEISKQTIITFGCSTILPK